MKGLFSILIALCSIQAFGLETDNYISWGHDLKDSSTHIDQYFTDEITAGLRKIQSPNTKTCRQVTVEVARQFASHLVHDNPVENWLFGVLSPEEMYPLDPNYVEESIYRDPYAFYIPWFGLSPNIQVNGLYFGTDKLSHFASTGMIYYKIYMNELKKGQTAPAAIRRAIDWGVLDEKKVHGYWASGVFSYADLEANYQGLLFFLNFCEGSAPYLKKNVSGEWILSQTPSIRQYVSGLWDESFELSYRLPENWEKVKPVVSQYCAKARSRQVLDRFAHYRQIRSDQFSKNYLEALKVSGAVPAPQSFDGLCSRL